MNMTTLYSTPKPVHKLSPVVRQMADLNFEGNIVPHAWFQSPKLRKNDNTPNLTAILLLADLVYWHRPVVERDENTGVVVAMRNKFRGAKYRANYEAIARRHGLPKRHIQEAATFLVERRVIEREVVNKLETAHATLYGVVFLTPVFSVLRELNQFDESVYETSERDCDAGDDDIEKELSDQGTPPTPPRDTPHATEYGGARQDVTPPTPDGDTPHAVEGALGEYSKTPSEISIEKTTTTRARVGSHAVTDADVVVSSKNNSSKKQSDSDAFIANQLIDAGVCETEAVRLVNQHGEERCRQQLAYLPYRKPVDHGAVLRSSIVANWSEPPSYTAAQANKRKAQVDAEKRQEQQAESDEQAREEAAVAAHRDAVYAAMSEAARAELEEAVWKRAIQKAATPLRAKLEQASKSEEALPPALQAFLRIARASLLDEMVCE